MIKIKRDGTRAVIEIDSHLAVAAPVYPFHWETGDQNWAELLAINLRTELYTRVKRIRREAYDAGYRDGRGKKKRVDWFDGELL